MGKKSGRHNSTTTTNAADAPKATSFVLKLPTHCQCKGCGDKIGAAVKDLTLRCDGILSLDQSSLATKGELAVVTTATVDPEKLRRRLRKATGKTVDLVFPKPPPADKPAVQGKDDAAAVQALLARLMQQQQQAVHAHHGQPMPDAAAWNALQHGGYGQAYAYPWVVQQQQQVTPPEPYFAAYPAVASWGAYPAAYPPHDGLGGAYGGGGGWFGH